MVKDLKVRKCMICHKNEVVEEWAYRCDECIKEFYENYDETKGRYRRMKHIGSHRTSPDYKKRLHEFREGKQ